MLAEEEGQLMILRDWTEGKTRCLGDPRLLKVLWVSVANKLDDKLWNSLVCKFTPATELLIEINLPPTIKTQIMLVRFLVELEVKDVI